MATSTHNKYVSIPDWFSSSSSTPITSAEKPANITNVYYGGGSGGDTTGITEIPIDNKTIVWLDLVITVPIDNDKIIINTEGKITTSGTTGVWELRQLTDGTNYIYTTYPVVTQLGITMYAGTDGLDLGSIYDGLPIDNATIYWDLDENGNKILKAVGSSGGVADSVAWANVIGKPDWLLDGKVLYTEIEGIPDLSGFITKDYVDGKFVTFGLNETIDGIKTFTNGIKIGTSLINQSLNDIIYIDANLAVRGGITMYAADIIDIPSILDSLPVAGTESKGIASFDSSYFSVTNGKVTLLADNVGLNESELAEYLNTNNYAKKSDIPSLNGYATQSWVESKGYALNSDLMSLTTKVDDFLEGSDTDTIINKWLELEAFLSGLSESDNLATILGNKADKSELTKYIPISGYTEVSGEKNFTGGLKVNGSPIVYDSTKKYWKLEGDLLVTGGVTMYGSDSSFTPSTIMDAILYDSATLGINSNGQLYVKGGAGGGINTTDLQNYLTQNSYLNVTSGDNRYLKLSGGTITGTLAVYENLGVGGTIINKNHYLFARDNANADWIVTNKNWGAEYVLIHSGNIGSYNAGSATKLQTARTIWGQSFDGSGNVSGELALGSSCITGFQGANILDARSSWVILGEGANAKGWTIYINGYNINFRSGSSSGSAMYINSDLNIGVRTTTPSYNFDVNGTLNATTIYQNGTTLANTYLSLSGGTMNGIITMPKNYQIQWGSSSMMIYGEDTNAISIVAPLGLYVNSKEVWHSGNLNPSNYLPLSGGTMTGNISLGGTTTNKIGTNIVDTTGGYQEFTHLNSHGYIAIGPFNGSVAHIYTDRPSFYFNKDLYVNDAKVWHAGNDGSGSTLDADKLDGVEYQNILERGYSGVSRCSGVGWYRIGEFKGTESNIILLIHRLYNNNAPESYAFSITRVMGTDNYCITQLSGTYGTQIITSIRINFDWDKNGYVDFYYNTTSANNVCWTIIGGATAYTGATFNPTTLSVQKTITPIKGFQTSGDILSHGGITMYSMRSLKNVVDERGLSLSELSTIKPTRYTWKDGRDNRLHFGGIADDIQQVLPEVVYSTSDGILTMDYGNAAFAVASSLIKPVVDHEKRIAMLEEENKQLRQEVERLKSA